MSSTGLSAAIKREEKRLSLSYESHSPPHKKLCTLPMIIVRCNWELIVLVAFYLDFV